MTKEKRIIYMRQWRKNHPGYDYHPDKNKVRKYYMDNKNKILEYQNNRLKELRNDPKFKEEERIKQIGYRKNMRARVGHILNQRTKEWRVKVKEDIIRNYSNGSMCCAHCGFKDIRALCLDHINNDGAKHRKELIGKNAGLGSAIYNILRKENFPKGFQVLCCNCNIIKEREKNIV